MKQVKRIFMALVYGVILGGAMGLIFYLTGYSAWKLIIAISGFFTALGYWLGSGTH